MTSTTFWWASITVLLLVLSSPATGTLKRWNPATCFYHSPPHIRDNLNEPPPASSPSVLSAIQKKSVDLFVKCKSLVRRRGDRRSRINASPELRSRRSSSFSGQLSPQLISESRRIASDRSLTDGPAFESRRHAFDIMELANGETYEFEEDILYLPAPSTDGAAAADDDTCSIASHISATTRTLPDTKIIEELMQQGPVSGLVISDMVDDLLSAYIGEAVHDLNNTTDISDEPDSSSLSSLWSFQSDWHDIYHAIVVLDQDWDHAVDTIVPLFQRYDRLSEDLQNALQNLVTLYEMRVVYDLACVVDQSLAIVSRSYRYTLTFPGWKRAHGLCERLAISLIHQVITQDIDIGLEKVQPGSASEDILKVTGLDANAKFRTMLYNRTRNSWRARDIAINDIVLKAILEADSIDPSTLQDPSPSLYMSEMPDFHLVDSTCFEEIREVYEKIMAMFVERYARDTKFGSIYQAPLKKSDYTTDELRSLLESAEKDKDLDQLNLAIESGLYFEFDRFSEQSLMRQTLLEEIAKAQRRLTISRALPICIDLITGEFGGIPRDDRYRLVLYIRSQTMVEIVLNDVVYGRVHAQSMQNRIMNILDTDWAMPLLLFDNYRHVWRPTEISLNIIVDMALAKLAAQNPASDIEQCHHVDDRAQSESRASDSDVQGPDDWLEPDLQNVAIVNDEHSVYHTASSSVGE